MSPGLGAGVGVGLSGGVLAGDPLAILGDTGLVYVDEEDISSYGDGGDISTWTNRFTSYPDLTQVTTNWYPRYNIAQDAALFDGANDRIGIALGAITATDPVSVWILLNNLDTVDYPYDGGGSSNRHNIHMSAGNWQMHAGLVVAIGTVPVGWHWVRVTFRGDATSEGVINGGTPVVGDCGSHSLSGFILGARTGGSGGWWNGYIKKVIVAEGETAAQRAAMDTWVQAQVDAI